MLDKTIQNGAMRPPMLEGAKRPSNSDDKQYRDDNDAIQDVAKRSPMLDEAIQNGAMRPPMLDGAMRPSNSDDNQYRDDNDAIQDVARCHQCWTRPSRMGP